MNDPDVIYDVLYYAFIELRERGHQSGDKVVFHLADLLHGIPPQLAQVARGERTYAEVLASLEAKVDEKGVRSWLENIYGQMGHKSA